MVNAAVAAALWAYPVALATASRVSLYTLAEHVSVWDNV
jgi:hypothetical protein